MADGGARGHVRQYVRGLNTSVAGNAKAFGFSTTITVSFGVVSAIQGLPTWPELLGFSLSAVASFSLLNLLVAHFLQQEPARPMGTRALLMGTATDFLAVGAGVGTALALQQVVRGWHSWMLIPFCATLVYLLVQGMEMAIGREEEDEDDDE